MLLLSFLLLFCGLCAVIAGVLFTTLHLVGSGKWPGFFPHQWNARLKKSALLTAAGFGLTLAGILAGYGI